MMLKHVLPIIALVLACQWPAPSQSQSTIEVLVNKAIVRSEKALHDGHFEKARNKVALTAFNGEELGSPQVITLTVQDIRIKGFMNLVYAQPNDQEERLYRLRALLPAARILENKRLQGDYYRAYSGALRSLGRADSAGFYDTLAMSVFETIEDHETLAEIRAINIMRRHIRLFEADEKEAILEMIPVYENEITYSEKHSRFALAYNTRHLAQIYRRQTDDFEKALSLFERSLELRQELGFRPFIPASHSSIGDVLLKLERFETAIQAYRKAQKTADAIGFVRYQCYPLMMIGDCFKQTENEKSALDYYQQALDKALELNYGSIVEQARERIRVLE